MPEDLELPDWVSEPRSSLPHVDEAPPLRRADLRRAAEEARRSAAGRVSPGHGDTRTARQLTPRQPARSQAREPVPMTRADRRRMEHEAQKRRQHARRPQVVEMVPPDADPEAAAPLRSRRELRAPRRRGATSVAVARRRVMATLAVTSTLAVGLWTLWPSGESSGPGRDTADLTAAAVSRASSDPTAAAEEPPPSPTIAPDPDRVTAPVAGTGKVSSVAMPTIAAPTVNPTRTIRVGLQIERGAGVDTAEAARIVSDTLGDARGWQTKDRVRFRAVSPSALADGDVDITIVLASPTLTDKLCKPLRTRGQVSCFNLRKVVLNVRRWTEGVPGYGKDLAAYRQYMVNHEIGHGLYHGHVECPGKGVLAPIMLQQTKGLDGCKPNAWPTRK